MKLFAAFLIAMASASAISRRQDDPNDVDVTDACMAYDGTWTQNTHAIVVTWSQTINIWATLIGEFDLIDGQFFIHSFNNDCDHLSSANLEPQGGFNGFRGEVRGSRGFVTMDVNCFDSACPNGVRIGKVDLVDMSEGVPYICQDDESWVDGITTYAYKVCTFLSDNQGKG